MKINNKDKKILQELARKKAEIAALPIQQETIALWKALNRLQPVRPMVMIDQQPWHEMDTEEKELELRTEDEFARFLEFDLRRDLYEWKYLRTDRVIEPFVTVPRPIEGMGFGIIRDDDTVTLDLDNDVVGHHYNDQIETEADLEKIKDPLITLDETLDREREETARAIFDGILDVRMQGVGSETRMRGLTPLYFSPWDRIVEWRGTENILLDLIDRPEFMHRLVARISDVYHMQLDQLEAQGLLGSRFSTVHCTGAFADELPSANFNPDKPTAKDNWTFGMAQFFTTVSPGMHQEFEIPYAKKWYERFGLGYYGCCEPLDQKIDIIRELPNVRKISMSSWVDVARGAEAIGRDYVFSRKPSPAFFARDEWCPDEFRKDIEETKRICEGNGCPLEFIFKDISTVRYQPQRLWEMARIAMEVVQN
jgi:hypothetical protein